jgi:3-isopropylmalate dehydratase/3-isopropylmalate/(R)-2-methylmalate dehydratase small subunit
MIAPLTTVSGTAYPFGMKNCDTDVIIAAEWLKTISRTGLGKGAFAALRSASPTVFDAPQFAGSPILIAGDNFGCGSSREHAAWALADMGIRVVIAPSFSDIFSGNAFKNGILTVVLPQEQVDRLMIVAAGDPIDIDLAEQLVTTRFQDRFTFEIDAFRKACLLEGLDEISLTLGSDADITRYEDDLAQQRPWQMPTAGTPRAIG